MLYIWVRYLDRGTTTQIELYAVCLPLPPAWRGETIQASGAKIATAAYYFSLSFCFLQPCEVSPHEVLLPLARLSRLHGILQ